VDVVGPTSHFFVSQRLRLHYVDWGNAAAPTLVLVHGNRDHARSWDWVARELRHEWHVVALDLRGHGDSGWAYGGPYAIADNVLDLANLIEALGPGSVTLVGHSLGGSVTVMYAGTYPERVRKLVSIEGLGPPPAMIERMRARPPHERVQDWIRQMRGLAGRQPRRYPSLDDAAKRMRDENAFLSEDQALHLTIHGVNRNEDGSYSWKFDNYTRTFAPYRFDVEDMRTLWARITCPVLLVRGADSWAGDPVADGRLAVFRDARSLTIERAGHWVHHDQLDAFLAALRSFLGRGNGDGNGDVL
jgi:pimeloyl-ACP methyl ester carboxylesterase